LTKVYSLTKAKARFSEIINRLIYQKDEVVVTKKNKEVAVLLPYETYQDLKKGKGGGLIEAAKSLANLDSEIEAMCDAIYEEREKEKTREVKL
jgi:prevent-host-death family protein